jgi:hypothetical protein
MVGAVYRALDVSKQRVDLVELGELCAGRSATGDYRLEQAPGVAHGGEASQPVGDNNAAQALISFLPNPRAQLRRIASG